MADKTKKRTTRKASEDKEVQEDQTASEASTETKDDAAVENKAPMFKLNDSLPSLRPGPQMRGSRPAPKAEEKSPVLEELEACGVDPSVIEEVAQFVDPTVTFDFKNRYVGRNPYVTGPDGRRQPAQYDLKGFVRVGQNAFAAKAYASKPQDDGFRRIHVEIGDNGVPDHDEAVNKIAGKFEYIDEKTGEVIAGATGYAAVLQQVRTETGPELVKILQSMVERNGENTGDAEKIHARFVELDKALERHGDHIKGTYIVQNGRLPIMRRCTGPQIEMWTERAAAWLCSPAGHNILARMGVDPNKCVGFRFRESFRMPDQNTVQDQDAEGGLPISEAANALSAN